MDGDEVFDIDYRTLMIFLAVLLSIIVVLFHGSQHVNRNKLQTVEQRSSGNQEE